MWSNYDSVELEDSKTIEGVSVGLENNQINSWRISFAGPSDTLYEGGYFQAMMKFPDDYPNSPPQFKFLTEMWHPNSNQSFDFKSLPRWPRLHLHSSRPR